MRQRSKLLLGAMIVAVAPLAARLPEITGYFVADPISRYSGIVTSARQGVYPGLPELDPNAGFTGQALGRRAAASWVEGRIPWWNPYEGVGVPLAGEMQSASFFPLTLLHLLPNGHLFLLLALQIIAGLATYFLLRCLSLSYTAAVTGGILFGFNGAIAWITHAPANPVPFLPLLLLGVEFAVKETAARRGYLGTVLIAVSLWLSLVAGFPETAYINGLVVVLWTAVRLWQCGNRRTFSARIAAGVVLGLMLSGPVLVAFYEYMQQAEVGGHRGGGFANLALPGRVLLQAFFPYILGNPYLHSEQNDSLAALWGNVGGYLSIIVVFAATVGMVGKRQRVLRMVLAGWTVVAIGKSYGMPGLVQACNLLPFVKDIAWYRYSPASWELTTTVLAAFALDDLRDESLRRTLWRYGAALALVIGITAVLVGSALPWLHSLEKTQFSSRWCAFSIGWPIAGLVLITLAAWFRGGAAKTQVLAAVLSIDAVVLLVIPRFSEARRVEYGGLPGVQFLQNNLGLQRFYSLGPIAPNYGSFFGTAELNHNDLPIASRWTKFIKDHLHAYDNPILFTGEHYYDKTLPNPEDELRRNLAWYEWVGVKYIVQRSGWPPFFREGLVPPTEDRGNTPIVLPDAGQITGRLLVPGGPAQTVGAVDLLAATYAGTSRGILRLQLCASECTDAQLDASELLDNEFARFVLRDPLVLLPKSEVTYRIRYESRGKPMALWRFPTGAANDQAISTSLGKLQNSGLKLRFERTPDDQERARLVHRDAAMAIYQLREPKPYFEVTKGTCKLTVNSRTSLQADCQGRAELVRRELFFPGWSATANSAPISIEEYGGLFQQVSLDSGTSRVAFSYTPTRGRLACWGSGLGVLGIGLCLICWRGPGVCGSTLRRPGGSTRGPRPRRWSGHPPPRSGSLGPPGAGEPLDHAPERGPCTPGRSPGPTRSRDTSGSCRPAPGQSRSSWAWPARFA